jgi:hypothetical protein
MICLLTDKTFGQRKIVCFVPRQGFALAIKEVSPWKRIDAIRMEMLPTITDSKSSKKIKLGILFPTACPEKKRSYDLLVTTDS